MTDAAGCGSLAEISPERVPAATPAHGAGRRVLAQPKKSAPEGAQSTGVENT